MVGDHVQKRFASVVHKSLDAYSNNFGNMVNHSLVFARAANAPWNAAEVQLKQGARSSHSDAYVDSRRASASHRPTGA